MNCAMNRNGDHGVDLLRESQLKTIMLGQPTALDLGKALRAVARASNYNKKLFARAPARARQAQSRAQRLVVSEQAAKSQEKEAAAEQREEHKRQRDAAVSDLMSTLHAQMTIIGMRADGGCEQRQLRWARSSQRYSTASSCTSSASNRASSTTTSPPAC